MKILIYTEYFYPIPGGVQTVVSDLAYGLSEWQTKQGTSESFDVTVVTRTGERCPEDSTYPFKLVRRPSFWRLCQIIRGVDIVHIAGPALLPLAIAFLLRKPVAVEHHGFHAGCPNGLLFLEDEQAPCPGHFMARHYRRCLVCNRAAVGTFRSLYWLMMTPVRRWLSNRAGVNIMPTSWLGGVLALNRMTTIHHGVSNRACCQDHRPGISLFAFQGRLVSTKGAGLLIDAARILRQKGLTADLKFIGDGPELPVLKSRGAELGGHVEFTGHLASEDLDEIVCEAAAVVMPSLGGEVFGLVAAENMMRGKVLIVSDIGALHEVVGQAGLTFPTNDAAALADRMRQVLEDSELSRSLGKAARERALRLFDLDTMIEAHVSVYRAPRAHM